MHFHRSFQKPPRIVRLHQQLCCVPRSIQHFAASTTHRSANTFADRSIDKIVVKRRTGSLCLCLYTLPILSPPSAAPRSRPTPCRGLFLGAASASEASTGRTILEIAAGFVDCSALPEEPTMPQSTWSEVLSFLWKLWSWNRGFYVPHFIAAVLVSGKPCFFIIPFNLASCFGLASIRTVIHHFPLYSSDTWYFILFSEYWSFTFLITTSLSPFFEASTFPFLNLITPSISPLLPKYTNFFYLISFLPSDWHFAQLITLSQWLLCSILINLRLYFFLSILSLSYILPWTYERSCPLFELLSWQLRALFFLYVFLSSFHFLVVLYLWVTCTLPPFFYRLPASILLAIVCHVMETLSS